MNNMLRGSQHIVTDDGGTLKNDHLDNSVAVSRRLVEGDEGQQRRDSTSSPDRQIISFIPASRIYRPNIPKNGHVYVIQECFSSRVLALVEGSIKVVPWKEAAAGFRWRCVERNGWLRFQDLVSGRYLSCGNNERLITTRKWSPSEEKTFNFTVRPNMGRGYALLRFQHSSLRLVICAPDIDEPEDSEYLPTDVCSGVTWEFLEEDPNPNPQWGLSAPKVVARRGWQCEVNDRSR